MPIFKLLSIITFFGGFKNLLDFLFINELHSTGIQRNPYKKSCCSSLGNMIYKKRSKMMVLETLRFQSVEFSMPFIALQDRSFVW